MSPVWTTVASPLGDLVLVGDGEAVCGLHMLAGPRPVAVEASWREDKAAFAAAREQLERYFAGRLRRFELAIEPRGTEFQRRVWHAVAEIPHGATATYGELARRLGRPDAARAVGAANGANPVPILIPCHRVLGASGALTGYGGGLERKRALLELEASGAAPGRVSSSSV